MLKSLSDLLPSIPDVKVVDVGASPIDAYTPSRFLEYRSPGTLTQVHISSG